MPLRYVELHARSAFSFLRGASVPEDYASLCAAMDQPGMALLDTNGFYGSPRFHQAMTKARLTAYVGAEIECVDGAHYPLLAINRRGYQNLCRLITRMKLRVPKNQPARATREELREFAGDWICLTGADNGPLAQGLREMDGRATLLRLRDTFGPKNVYIELQRHFLRGQEAHNQAAIEWGRSLGIPLVAANAPCYAEPRQRELLDVFTCLRNHTTLAKAGRLLECNAERYPKSTQEMVRLFSDVPEAVANTEEVASRLQFTLKDLGYQFPHYPAPDGHTEASYLRYLTETFARKRFRERYETARPQLEKELALIEKLGFSGYFLIVWDIVAYCKSNGILIQGRGSAANSAVCYALEITAVDSVKMDLLFERFLSENREEWPDIDLDLPSGEQREKAIQYVYKRYGQLGAAMTANVITYRGKSAAREAGKVLGFDEETIGRLAKLTPMWGWTDASDNPERHFREAGLDLSNRRVRKFLELVVGLQDLPRHLSQHSGGMVVCQGQLDSIVPLEPATGKNRVVVQWDKEDCADMRIVKVDLLGLGMMAVLEESIELIERHHGENVDLGNLKQDDPKVYAGLQQADTIGLFQVESRAQQASLPRMKPEKFYDLVVQVAIIRPGPIEGKMAHPYLKRRQGTEKPEPLHPSLEPILSRTLGVPLFQEQLLRMAMAAASFTGGEAEELRRAFGFKRSEKRMREIEGKLRAGMTRNGITGQTQDTIVKSITSFAMFGFPESHAASFALLAYASAYLQTYYRAAFTCALLNNQPMGFYHPSTLVKDAQRHGLRVLPVDINRSKARCTLEDLQLRLGFNYVRGLSAAAAAAIVAKQPFSAIGDLALRVPELRRDQLEQLAALGALNGIGATHRRDALWQVSWHGRQAGALLAAVPEATQESPLRQMTIEERLMADSVGSGMTTGKHPLAYRRAELDKLRVVPAAGLSAIPNGRTVRVAGNVIVRQRPGTAKGILFLSLEDETGISNIVVMPDLFEKYRLSILSCPWIMVEGRMQNKDKVTHILARRISPLENPLAMATRSHDFH
ncbi:MAG TPA: error-prone DNA polymerase [Bryobacteraceae bacterium]|nr:error-prone DNA polymerase [Bryobacteraceae bacterium]